MAELRQVFIRNLKHYRKLKGMRQLDLALELGKNPNYINSVENGKYFPSPETIEQIAAFLGIEPVRLFDRETETPATERRGQEIDLKAIESQLQKTISKDITEIFKAL